MNQSEREHAPAETTASTDFDRLLSKSSVVAFNTRDMLTGDTFDKVLRLAELMASGRSTVPKHLHSNVGDCAAIIGQAMRWGMDHNAVALKTHLVSGVLGYEAQLVVAVLNNSPLLATRLNYRWADEWDGTKGKTDESAAHWCEVSATLRGEREPRVLRITMAQVGAVRNSPNWSTDARQQLAYLGAKRWGRLHAPDVLLGVYTPDELQEDTGAGEPTPPPPPPPASPPPPLPEYSSADFTKNLPKWRALLSDGRRTAEDLLATLETRATFSEEQRTKIRALKADPPAPEVPTLTFAQVDSALRKARNVDELDVAGESIGSVVGPDSETMRAELRETHAQLRAKMAPASSEGGAP